MTVSTSWVPEMKIKLKIKSEIKRDNAISNEGKLKHDKNDKMYTYFSTSRKNTSRIQLQYQGGSEENRGHRG